MHGFGMMPAAGATKPLGDFDDIAGAMNPRDGWPGPEYKTIAPDQSLERHFDFGWLGSPLPVLQSD